MHFIFHELQMAEQKDIKRLGKKIALFSLPLMFIFLLNILIDPFNLNRIVNLPFSKKEIACHFNERLWKLNHFMQFPRQYIILGDSRAARFSEEKIFSLTGKHFTNLAFSGATLPEIVDTFWFITSKYRPIEIFLSINFDRFNDWQAANGVHEAVKLIDNPLLNYIQPQTCKAMGSLLLEFFLKNNVSQQPPMTRNNFWKLQIDEIDKGYQRHTHPFYASRQLSKIAEYCNQHSIKLFFIILPTHQDLQQRIDIAHLREQEQSFKKFISSLAHVYDFDTVNDFTINKNNFDDPKHISYQAMDHITSLVWNKN